MPGGMVSHKNKPWTYRWLCVRCNVCGTAEHKDSAECWHCGKSDALEGAAAWKPCNDIQRAQVGIRVEPLPEWEAYARR